ncbi:hypothetical protein [Alkaliphilus metalliredigens]|nr:hypothetical protein [Alkaliphilus metalliredigens]
MNEKSWLKYLFIILSIIIMVYWGHHVFVSIRKNTMETFDYNIYLQNIIAMSFYGIIGLLLGLEHLIKEIKKEGKWVINIPKIVLMGVPALYFSLSIFIFYNNLFLNNIWSQPISILLTKGNSNFIIVFQVILGHTIITSFNKDNHNSESIEK